MRLIKSERTRSNISQALIIICALIMLFLAFIPIMLMIFQSMKSQVQIYGNFWSLPDPIQWSNYSSAVKALYLNMFNSIITVGVSTVLSVLLASMSGYVLAKLDFPGRKALYIAIVSIMMIPSVLTLTPLFKLVEELGLKNNWWALILPWISGGQVFGIILCRTFIMEQPKVLFESARIDGANELQAFFKIALPLAKPILATLAIMNMIGFYNDYVWPLMIISSTSKQVITVAVQVFTGSLAKTNIGVMVAGYVFATIPLLILFMAGSRLYMEGITSGAVKA